MRALYNNFYDHRIGVYHTVKKRFKFISLGLLSTLFLILATGLANAYTYNSTNELNQLSQAPGREGQAAPHVNQVSNDIGEVTLEFINPYNFSACFEYRTDGDTSQVIDTNPPGYPETDRYPYHCLSGGVHSKTETIEANSYVEVRSAFGAENQWFFDWTEFEVLNPDPQNKHQMSVSGNVHRDHSLNHCYNKTTCEDRAENLGEGWEINLYKEASDNSWEFVKATQTNPSGDFAFSAVKEAGVYHVCEVLKVGWTQQTQNWSGTPYHIATDNLSNNDSEGPYCRTINYPDTGNYSNKFYFGNVDTQKPEGNIAYDGGIDISGVRYLSKIDNLKFNGNFSDNYALDQTSYVVWTVNSNFTNRSLYCGNWFNTSTTEQLSGINDSVNNIAVGTTGNCASKSWEDGYYEIGHRVYDVAGNYTSLNVPTQKFVIDSDTPNIEIENINVSNNKKLSFDLTATDNLSGLQIVAANIYDETNTTKLIDLGEGSPTRLNVPHSGLPEGTLSFATSLDDIDVGLLSTGTYTIRAYAKDHAGNELRFKLVQFDVDNTAPTIPTNTFTATPSGTSVPNGGFTQEEHFTFNLDSANDTIRYQLKYWNNIIGSTFKVGSPWNPTDLSGYSSGLGIYNDRFTQGEGVHYFAFSACDAAGNCSDYSNPFIVTYDNTAPAIVFNGHTPNDNVITPSVTASDPNTPLSYIWTPNDTDSDNNVDISDPNALEPDFTVNADGTYSFRLTVTDNAGNSASIDFGFTYTAQLIDNSFTSSPPNNNEDNNNDANDNNDNEGENNSGFTNVTAGAPGAPGQVLAATTDNPDDDGENIDEEEENDVQADASGVSSSATDEKANKSGWSWWWILPIIAAFLLLLALLRRRSEEEN